MSASLRAAAARRFSSAATSPPPPSPLNTYLAALANGPSLRTGYTHFFSRRTGEDRSAAAKFRAKCRTGEFSDQTSGQVMSFVQANLVAVRQEHAFDFLRFCLANPRACPLLDVTAPGDPSPRVVADAASDLRPPLHARAYCTPQ